MEPILIPLIVFASFFGMVYVWLTTRNKERLALIEKGADASLWNVKRSNRTNYTLKIGMLAVGIGIGVLVGSLLESYTALDEEVAFPSMIFLFGGGFLIANALIERKTREKEEK
jgi:CBS domain containing-hemolysin-like protein